MKREFVISLLAGLAGCLHAAGLEVWSPVSDHAIVQRDMPFPVRGNASAGEQVSVSFAGRVKSTVAAADGKWGVVMDPPRTGDSGTLVVQASTSLRFENITAGDVWIFAGDAFMDKRVEAVRSARSEMSSVKFPDVRLFRVPITAAKEPRERVSGAWAVADRRSVGAFPALAYLFAKLEQAQAGVPVGIVALCDPEPVAIQRGGKVTGSPVEAWMSEGALRAIPGAAPIFEYYQSKSEMRDAMLEYENALGDWKLKMGKAFGTELRELERREPDVWYDYLAEMRKAGKQAPADPPRKPTAESLRMATTHASNLYCGMVAPLAGLPVRGVTLCIGLANAPRATQFRTLFPALMEDWRKAWGRANLPFVFLQQGRAVHPNMDPRAVSELREAQADALSMPQTRMVPCMDLAGNLFPEDLAAVAQRMAVCALSLSTSGTAGTLGPVIESVLFEGNQAVVKLKQGAGGLTARGGGAIRGFALTERPNRWAYAEAKVEGDRLFVSHPKIRHPAALRYDWVVEPAFEGNLTDSSGLPAQPYRSDSWPSFTDTPAALKPNAVATIQPTDLYPVVDPSLPRVLLIGDSIMNGYSPAVVEALRGKANVVRMVAFGMIGRDDAAAAEFCATKLKDGDYALIHYNDGLHSLPPRITDEQFGVGLSAMLKHLKTVTPRVIWATTTPAPDRNNTLGPESQNAAVVTRNQMSKKIAAEQGVSVIDLYGLVEPRRETLQGFANLHFTPEGSKLMGEEIAARIAEELEKK
jgi:sialate O-acetylesterase